jgi:hypothetical protein
LLPGIEPQAVEAGAVRPATSFALLWGDLLLLVMRLADQPPQAAQEPRA